MHRLDPKRSIADRAFFALFIAVWALLLPSPAFAGDLSVEDAWIRFPPPLANTAGYMTLVNGGDAPIRITGVRSDAVERLELHETVIENAVARMHRIEVIEIPAGERVKLAPRGLHLMLIRPGQLEVGAQVELVFSVEGQDDLIVEVPVRRETPAH
jgi:copper(I)-binding protein